MFVRSVYSDESHFNVPSIWGARWHHGVRNSHFFERKESRSSESNRRRQLPSQRLTVRPNRVAHDFELLRREALKGDLLIALCSQQRGLDFCVRGIPPWEGRGVSVCLCVCVWGGGGGEGGGGAWVLLPSVQPSMLHITSLRTYIFINLVDLSVNH